MIFFYIFLALAVIVALVILVYLFIPARLYLICNEKEKSATIRILFLKFDVMELIEALGNDPESEEKPKKKKRGKREAPRRKPQEQKIDLFGFILFVGRVIRVLAIALKEQLDGSKLFLKEFVLILGTDDAATTALLSGTVTNLANNFLAILDGFTDLRCDPKGLRIAPDFTAETTKFSLNLHLSFRLVHLIGVIERAELRLFERKEVDYARNSLKTGH